MNFESQSAHTLTFNVSNGRETYKEDLEIFVTDVNEPVEDFAVDIGPVKSNTPIGAVVGTFSGYDDDGTAITYFSNPNPKLDNAEFEKYFGIVGDEIVVSNRIEAGVAPSELELRFIAQSGGVNYGNILTKIKIDFVDNAISSEDAQSIAQSDLIGTENADVFYIAEGSNFSAVNIHDFDQEAGDVLDISALLVGYDDETNSPDGFIQILSDNGDTIISLDADGGANGFEEVATLIDTSITGDLENLIDRGVIEVLV